MRRGVSRHIARTVGFLGQIKQANSVTKAATLGESIEGRNSDLVGTGGRLYIIAPRLEPVGRIVFDSEIDSGNIASWDIYAPSIGKSYHSPPPREVVETTSGNEPTHGSEVSTTAVSGMRYRDRWGSPEPRRDGHVNPGLYPIEQVFPDSESEIDELSGLVKPFIGAPSPEYPTCDMYPAYSSGPTSNVTSYLRQGRRLTHDEEKRM